MAAKKKMRAPKAAALSMSADQISAKADELRWFAEQIDRYAQSMRAMEIEALKVLPGNWTQATGQIRNFITQQIANKLTAEAAAQGIDAHQVYEQGWGKKK